MLRRASAPSWSARSSHRCPPGKRPARSPIFWRRLGELGYLGLDFPAEYGGAGGDFFSSVVLGEELARCRSGGVAFSVLVHTDMSSPWLVRFGTEAQKRKYLPGIIQGETVCALGITEPGAGSDMAALTTRADRGDHYALSGSKIFITNGVYGDLYFIAARTGPATPSAATTGSRCSWSSAARRVQVSRKLDKLGMRASDTAELVFQDCRVPAANLLGQEGRGFQQLAAGLQRERVMAGALALAGAGQAGGHHGLPPRAHRLRRAAQPAAGPAPSAGRPGHRDGGGASPPLSRGGALRGR